MSADPHAILLGERDKMLTQLRAINNRIAGMERAIEIVGEIENRPDDENEEDQP